MTNVARLPGPIADVWDWQLLGSCRGADSARFFHPDGERGASRGRREAAAKAVCGSCPVRAECAAHALATREPYGVWGGFTETERLRLLATGWEDLADRRRTRADVSGLELRLGIRPPNVTALRAVNGSGTCTGSPSPLAAQPQRPPLPVQRRGARRPVGATAQQAG